MQKYAELDKWYGIKIRLRESVDRVVRHDRFVVMLIGIFSDDHKLPLQEGSRKNVDGTLGDAKAHFEFPI